MNFSKHLSAPALYDSLKHNFNKLKDEYPCRGEIQISDILMSGVAMFSLKSPSLLQFDQSKSDKIVSNNLKTLYKVDHPPSDSYMRTRLDEVSPDKLLSSFKEIFSAVQRGKKLDRYKFFDKYYLLSIDGTGHYSSSKVKCKSCCSKHHKNGKVTYYHQILCSAIVHPDEKTVLPLAPEAILKEDGDKKNDCERNASKRLLPRIRKEHPHLPLIVIEDALASNAPHIKLLQDLDMKFILGVKPGDHKYLFDWIADSDEVKEHSYYKKGILCKFRYLNNVPLNDSNFDLRVNFLEYTEVLPNGKQKCCFSWVTDFIITKENCKKIMQGGRARWKIENETFNTLKNQGYNFEHNFGHGKKNLCTVFSYLMLLAFLIDQVQQLSCKVFNTALIKAKSKIRLFFKMRAVFDCVLIDSWHEMYMMIIDKPLTKPLFNSS